jgi:hypothetical protein
MLLIWTYNWVFRDRSAFWYLVHVAAMCMATSDQGQKDKQRRRQRQLHSRPSQRRHGAHHGEAANAARSDGTQNMHIQNAVK